MERLSNATLAQVPAGVATPGYDRLALPVRIVHLGAGTFQRGHQAVYTDEVMRLGGAGWGIYAASIKNPAISQALAQQDGLYTLRVHDGANVSARIVGSLAEVVCLADARKEVINALCSRSTEIVTLTLTERGYHYDAATDGLDESLPEVQLDLNAPQSARTPIGVLAWAIFQRKKLGLPPLTLLSCDHLRANGKVLQRVLEHYIERVQDDLGDSGLLQYFLDQYACPCSLVDRMTLPPTSADQEANDSLLGVHDKAPVVAEVFSQWIIQDWFSSGRPAWERAGAILVPHVAPFEQAQAGMLDVGRFVLAHMGAVAGYKSLDESMAQPVIAQYVHALLEDAIVTLPKHAGIDWKVYLDKLMLRFANPGIPVSSLQSAIDGSLALREGVLPVLEARMAKGLNIERHATAIAIWMRFLMGRGERQEELRVADPLQAEISAAVAKAGGHRANAFDLVEALLGVGAIFKPELAQDLEFARRVTAALQDLLSERTLGALALLNQPEKRREKA